MKGLAPQWGAAGLLASLPGHTVRAMVTFGPEVDA
jgi:hypothetical protein